jgi:hypothetical protein
MAIDRSRIKPSLFQALLRLADLLLIHALLAKLLTTLLMLFHTSARAAAAA